MRWTGTALAALLVSVGLSALTGCTGATSEVAAPAPSGPAAAVDAGVIAYLHSIGTDVTTVPTTDTPDEAVLSAAASFHESRTRRPAEVSLARATVHDYIAHADGEGGPPTLILDDRLVWVLVFFDGLQDHGDNAAPRPGEAPHEVRTVVVRLAVYVDAVTDEFLRAETVPAR